MDQICFMEEDEDMIDNFPHVLPVQCVSVWWGRAQIATSFDANESCSELQHLDCIFSVPLQTKMIDPCGEQKDLVPPS